MNAWLAGGIPVHLNKATADDEIEEWDFKRLGGSTNHLVFKVTGANAIKLSLSKEAADASEGFDIAADPTLEIPAQIARFWTRSAAGVSAFQAIGFIKRG